MKLPLSKKPLEKAGQSDIGQALQTAARSTLVTALGGQPGNGATNAGAAKSTKPLGWAAKPVLIVAGGVAGMTAASAAVSAVRRGQEDD